MNGKITYLLGSTHSGKSTFCKTWLKESDPDGLHRVVVNADTIRLAIHGNRYNHYSEPLVFSAQYLMLKTHYLYGYHICFDETSTTDTSIKRILEIDPNATPIVFNTPPEICWQRAQANNQLDMYQVIQRHHRQLRKLLDEGLVNVHKRLLEEIDNRVGRGKIV
jgi:predicted kinase